MVEVPDLQAAYERARNVVPDLPAPASQAWGLTDFRFTDPDGVYVRVTNRY